MIDFQKLYKENSGKELSYGETEIEAVEMLKLYALSQGCDVGL